MPGSLEGRNKLLIVPNKRQVFNGHLREVHTAYIDSLIPHSQYYSTEDSRTTHFSLVYSVLHTCIQEF